MDFERRFFEFRAEGGDTGVITGVAVPYGVPSTIGRFTETFKAGAFAPIGNEIRVNLQHERGRALARNVEGGGLVLVDSDIELRASLTLPDTVTGQEARALIERRVLTGFSAEFNVKPGGDTWRGMDRTVTAATLHGISLVDAPAHVGAQLDMEKRWKVSNGQPARRQIWL